MSLEKNKALIRRLTEAENRHNVALLDEFIAHDFIDERNTLFELRGLESTHGRHHSRGLPWKNHMVNQKAD